MAQSVVDIQEIEPGIIRLTMQDRLNKNTFSEDLMLGLIQAFKYINEKENCKAVILTGYDTYFASGGTRESLIAISEGKLKFTDRNIYSLALDCRLPVISAMQGHGIGGGFVMGLYSDFVILSRESIYTANFMKYGFTPGMGATYILLKKLGFSLGEEILLSARTYHGGELEKRGVPFKVLPREEVLPYAVQLARELAEKPRAALITLKDHLVAQIREQLPSVIARELEMHEKTFHQPEVRNRILDLFDS